MLIVTIRSDYTADFLVLELERRGAAFERFNTENYLALSDLSAVWYRRPVPPTLPADTKPDGRSGRRTGAGGA